MGLDVVPWIIPKVWGCDLSVLVLKLFFFFLMSNSRTDPNRIWVWTFSLGIERSLPCCFCPALTVTCSVTGPRCFLCYHSLALGSVLPAMSDEPLCLFCSQGSPGPSSGGLWPAAGCVGGWANDPASSRDSRMFKTTG